MLIDLLQQGTVELSSIGGHLIGRESPMIRVENLSQGDEALPDFALLILAAFGGAELRPDEGFVNCAQRGEDVRGMGPAGEFTIEIAHQTAIGQQSGESADRLDGEGRHREGEAEEELASDRSQPKDLPHPCGPPFRRRTAIHCGGSERQAL
jgi:hypothetical protein